MRHKRTIRKVSRDDLGDKWPLTCESGHVGLELDTIAVFKQKGGKTYALNGMARTRGYPDIEPIWADNPKLEGFKVNIRPLIKMALALKG